ncbi:MAG: zinc-binding dehydrogenase [Rhizobium sp.]|nr:zinc-binding dehydrogenase [Rhizobium sp.]
MRSAIHATFGKPDHVLELAESPVPEPGPGEIRVRMGLAAIHNHDLITVAGLYGHKPALPAIGGSEAMGIVEKLGDGVEGLALGQRVAASGLSGAWAESFVASAASVVPLPDGIDDETAAQMIAMPLSALVLLDYVGIGEDQWLIQNAATGAVAKVLAMIAASRGINVVNVVRRNEGVEELKALGIGNTVSSATPGWQDAVRAMTSGAPIAAAVDGVGGPSAGELMSLLGEGATLVSFGAMSGKSLEISGGDLIFKQAVVKGFWLSKIMRTAKPQDISRWMSELVRLVASGAVKLQTGGIYPLDRIAEAAAASAAPGRSGKILLRP